MILLLLSPPSPWHDSGFEDGNALSHCENLVLVPQRAEQVVFTTTLSVLVYLEST